MSAGGLLRVGVIGATGALGSELLDVLEERSFPISELLPVATERSLGREIEFAGEPRSIETDVTSLDGLDLVFLCAPQPASLEYARLALSARVPCVDLSGALSLQPDVPLLVAESLPADTAIQQPLVAGPAGPALAWSLVLAPLDEAAGVSRVVATSLEAASVAGRDGIDALSGQTIALFNQQELPESPEPLRSVAFDCLPNVGAPGDAGATDHELALAATLERLLGRPLELALTAIQVPTFSGDGAALTIETGRGLEPEDACAVLAKAPCVRVAGEEGEGASTRSSAGRDEVLVARVRRDPSCARGLQLWLAVDGLRLAASNGVKLAEARPLRSS